MITIDLLKNHPDSVPRLAEIWHEVLGKIWGPDIPLERVIQRFNEHLNVDVLPLTFIALNNEQPVGMCSLRKNEGWLWMSLKENLYLLWEASHECHY